VKLEIKNLSFKYDGFELKADLEVDEGEILTLLGPNGSGKTTLLKCIYGLLKPRERCVYLDGKDIHSLPLKQRAKLVGYVPQTHNPSFPYTVLEFVVMGKASQFGVFEQPSRKDYEEAREILKLVGIENLANRPYTNVSGGQLQLAMIARALIQNPKVLLLDEPTAHLDFGNQIKVLTTIRKIVTSKNLIAILTLHDPNLAVTFSDRIAIVNNGKILAVGDKNIVDGKLLASIYGVDVEVLTTENNLKFILPKVKI